jgi:hypothetical protein
VRLTLLQPATENSKEGKVKTENKGPRNPIKIIKIIKKTKKAV